MRLYRRVMALRHRATVGGRARNRVPPTTTARWRPSGRARHTVMGRASRRSRFPWAAVVGRLRLRRPRRYLTRSAPGRPGHRPRGPVRDGVPVAPPPLLVGAGTGVPGRDRAGAAPKAPWQPARGRVTGDKRHRVPRIDPVPAPLPVPCIRPEGTAGRRSPQTRGAGAAAPEATREASCPLSAPRPGRTMSPRPRSNARGPGEGSNVSPDRSRGWARGRDCRPSRLRGGREAAVPLPPVRRRVRRGAVPGVPSCRRRARRWWPPAGSAGGPGAPR